jgi:hypothetical protein
MSEEVQTTDEGTPEIASEVIREAESQGWVPKEKYRGNEADWVDAETFVKRGREIMPILRKNNENLLKDLNATKQQLKEFQEAAEEFKRFQKDAFERKITEYESRIQELKESRAQAISDGDGRKVNDLDEALDKAKEEVREAKLAAKEADKAPTPTEEGSSPALDPSLQSWLGRNDWFGKDRRLTSIANGIGDSLRLEFPALKGQAFLDKLDEVLAEEMPNKFGNASKKKPMSPVESGAGRMSRAGSSTRSYDNLPPEAKAACDRFVKQKLMSKEDYVLSYSWD